MSDRENESEEAVEGISAFRQFDHWERFLIIIILSGSNRNGLYEFSKNWRTVYDVKLWYATVLEVARAKNDIRAGVVKA